MEEFLWVEKHRPTDVQSCVLPNQLKSTLSEFVSSGDIPNVTFSGRSG